MQHQTTFLSESQQANNRITWLLAAQALLFAGYALLIDEPQPSSHVDSVERLKITLQALGLMTALATLVGVVCSGMASHAYYTDRVLRQKDEPDQASSDEERHEEASQSPTATQQWGVRTAITRVSWIATCSIPFSFLVAWVLI